MYRPFEPHDTLPPHVLAVCDNFHPQVKPFFKNYDYSQPYERDRVQFSRMDNITGHQQRCFMTYWAAYAGMKGGLTLDVGSAGVRHPWSVTADLYRGEQKVYGGEVYPDIQCDANDLSMFGDEAFCAIISSHLIEHLTKPAPQLLREWLRVVKHGGFIAGILPDNAYNDVLKMDKDHKQAWDARSFYEAALIPLEKDNLATIVEHDALANGFSFDFVLFRR